MFKANLVIALMAMILAGISRAQPSGPQQSAGKTDPALLAHWKFDEGSGDLAADSSGHGNVGDLVGANWATGTFGTALHLGGKHAWLSVPQIAGLDGSNELTLEAWVMWEAGGKYPNILSGGQWSPGGFLIFVSGTNCSFRMGRPIDPANPAAPWRESSAPLINGFETGKWYHLAATFKRPVITTYLNGKKAGSAQWDYPVGYKGDIHLGNWHGAPISHQGLIDEVKIFNRALSSAEVEASYVESSRRSGPEAAAYKVIPATSRPAAVLENALARLELDVRGRCIALVEKSRGRNLLSGAAPFAMINVKGQTLAPSRCSYADGRIRLDFGKKPQASAVIQCARNENYFSFSVLSVEGEGAESLVFASLPVVAGKHASSTSGAVVGEDWGVALRELNLQTEVTLGGSPLMLRATCKEQHGIIGSKVALVVAPGAQLLSVLRELVKHEKRPQSALGGPWALQAQEIRGSYLFASPSEQDIERWIDLAKRGGFTHLHHDSWYKSLGHYQPNPARFPSGLDGIKTMVQKVHAAGLKAGMHTLTGCIAPQDPWVTPVPDKRLAADASYTLAADMDEKSDTLLIEQPPQDHDVIWSYSGRGNALRIDDEIIQYSALSSSQPHGFQKCVRGAFGTRPAAHKKGQTVDHLRQIYLAFYPDEKTTLVGEVADAIARVYNECEFDQIYMDGAEGMGGMHAIQVMRDAIYQRLKRPAIVEASAWDHWSWYYHSRIGAWDHPKWGLKQFTDLHCAAIDGYRRGSLLQAQLGWWVVLGPSAASRAETPDEMEYFCSKALGFDAPSSTQGIGSLAAPANARMQEYLTMAGWYERLRLANYFPESVKAQLREPGKDFHLQRSEDGEWQLLPTRYLAHKVTGLNDGSSAWNIINDFAVQPLKMRLDALFSVMPYDSTDAVVIADATKIEQFKTRRAAQGIAHNLTQSAEQLKDGGKSLCFSATSKRDSRSGAWAHAGLSFKPYLSIGRCDALGVWIHGDGKGELLNLQLTTPREYMPAFGEHYVKIDFTGWRYFEIPLRERSSDQYRDHQWPYFSLSGIYMTPVNREHIGELNLYLNNLPPGETATVHLGPIKALRTTSAQLANPAVQINGQKLVLPVTLQSGDYIEMHSAEDCRLYDQRGTLLQRITIPGELPVVKPGQNQVAFSCEGAGAAPRAELTVITRGAPLEGRTPPDQVKWPHLRDDYDLPRIVTRLDGRENAWDVICRAGDSPAFGVEIDVEQAEAPDAAYNSPTAKTLESFETPEFFDAATPNPAAGLVYDPKVRISSTKPGVTQRLEPCADPVKFGSAAARYTASSTLSDNSGWSVFGKRFSEPLDLLNTKGIGFWLLGDGKGEAFKLQLRDSAGGWLDMVTHVTFSGWKYVQFDWSGAGKLDRTKLQQLLMYYNSIPSRETASCVVDEIRAVQESPGLTNLRLTSGSRTLLFPGKLETGDRLVFDGRDCRLYRKGIAEPLRFKPQGEWSTLQPGRNRVALTFDPAPQSPLRIAASLVRHYPAAGLER